MRRAASAPVWSRAAASFEPPASSPTMSEHWSSAGSWPEGDAYGVLQSSHAKRKPARRRYASTATHSGESEGKPQALGQRWRISSLSPSPGTAKPSRAVV